MPTKKIKYTTPIQFFPRSSKDVLKDDPSESQNIIIPLEPEHFKYGIYFNDGYDYMRHLISMDDFQDEETDLETLVSENRPVNMLPSQPTKSATVIKEFEFNDIEFGDDENFDNADHVAIEKMKQIASNEIDSEHLNALLSDGEFSDLEDNFVEMANAGNQNRVTTADPGLLKQFLDNGIYSLQEEMEDDGENAKDCFDFSSNVSKPINDISELINFESTYNQMKSMAMPNYENSRCSTFSHCFVNTFERTKDMFEIKEFVTPVDKDDFFYQNLYKGETKYDEEAVDQAILEWSGQKQRNAVTSAMDVRGKTSTRLPKIMEVPKRTVVKQDEERMEVIDSRDLREEPEITFTNVDQYHVRRAQDETPEERRERKKAIKTAKRCRTEEKKMLTNCYKKAKLSR